MTQEPWLLCGLGQDNPWWTALLKLELSLNDDRAAAPAAYQRLWRALATHGHTSLPAAFAAELLYGRLTTSAASSRQGSAAAALQLDLQLLNRLAATDWHGLAGAQLPPLTGLAAEPAPAVQQVAAALAAGSLSAEQLHSIWAEQGQGWLARALAWHWDGEQLEDVAAPVSGPLSALYGLESQTGRLRETVTAWLDGGSAQNILLYGSRGSGKSTAARALLHEYADRGLRMIELSARGFTGLAGLLRQLADSPLRFVLFADDLGFSRDDGVWQQLKSVLDGTLRAIPDNVIVLATTNRRTLVAARFSDRPDPLDDDANAWDTAEEKLALADRFGVVITFPAADQRRFLQTVAGLARERGLDPAELQEAALLFSRRAGGHSGRTARQFIDSLG